MTQAHFFLRSQEKYSDVASELIVYTYFFSASEEVFPEVKVFSFHSEASSYSLFGCHSGVFLNPTV